ncbi:anthrone oxygenase family protein [Rhodococcus tukisamuensis]|uniref:Uncharacterized membrane protein n=1 Tax=Rhodococcus tukisamuensis TaxID=168276 RepID=A0A1G6UET6_9NOCA|nr:anthrone oxygenase family protein [Rhodococcus tukisamuensis]SDD39754.1 Uncharacterized membrane protein [Rhodococcus tukisamuensis]
MDTNGIWTATRGGTLVTAVVLMGLMAGLFYAFAVSVMPGLGAADDRTFVESMQRINVAILNGWFGVAFGGALVFTVAALLTHLGRPAMPWIVAALVLYVAVLAVTIGINVPMNDRLAAAGSPDRIGDLAAVRSQFEASWVRWNIVRAFASTGALACLALAQWAVGTPE